MATDHALPVAWFRRGRAQSAAPDTGSENRGHSAVRGAPIEQARADLGRHLLDCGRCRKAIGRPEREGCAIGSRLRRQIEAHGADTQTGPIGRCWDSVSSQEAAATVLTIPPQAMAAASANTNRDDRAWGTNDSNTDTVEAEEQVGSLWTDTVSCCRCPAHLEVVFMGYGDRVRRVEAAGWRYKPGRRGEDRAWCRKCHREAGGTAG